MTRRFPAPWTIEHTPGGYVVKDATGWPVAYVYGTDDKSSRAAKDWRYLSIDEARRIATGIARLPDLLAQKK